MDDRQLYGIDESAYVIIDKPSQLDEILAGISYFRIKFLTFNIISENRIDERTIRNFFKDTPVDISFEVDNFDVMTKGEFIQKCVSVKAKYLFLSAYFKRVFYRSISAVRKRKIIVVHLTDGLTNAFPLHGLVLAHKFKGNIGSFLKCTMLYLHYIFAKADYSFYSLYPLKCCFAETTLPINTSTKPSVPRNVLNHLVDNPGISLIVPGWGMSAEQISVFFNVREYCATTKQKEFIINGISMQLDSFFTAEMLLRNFSIEKIYGTPSTVMYFAKVMDSKIECYVYLNGVLNKEYGVYFEYFYKKVGQRLGIKFFKSKPSLST